MNLNEECLLKYLQNPEELAGLTVLLQELQTALESNTAAALQNAT